MNWFSRWLGRRSCIRPANRAKLSLESMDGRFVPSAVTFTGTSSAENIRVSVIGGQSVYVIVNESTFYQYDAPDGLIIHAGGGDDTIHIPDNLNVDVTAYGDGGNDVVDYDSSGVTNSYTAANASFTATGGFHSLTVMSDVESTLLNVGGSIAVSAFNSVPFTFGGSTAYFSGTSSADTYYASGNQVVRSGDATVTLGTGTTANISGNDGNDSLAVYSGLSRVVSFTGGNGTDTINYSGSTGNDIFTLSSSSMYRTNDSNVYFSNDTEAFNVYGYAGNDTFNYYSTSSTITYLTDGGLGADQLIVFSGGIAGSVTHADGTGYYYFSTGANPVYFAAL